MLLQGIDAVLKPYLEESNLPRIITIGHSLGGGLAVLAAAHIAKKSDKYQEGSKSYTSQLLQTYTFAAPRVGDHALYKYMSSLGLTALQVKNTKDPVP